ncbi:MAG: ATP synthase F0 subunit B [Deltaproteobacteria bacterium]|jgi:F-type H+-transporting ATPase subunit b|nr:ATP synthase F0 subunit B [Deltaproteobacteria bacterium]
MVSMSFDWSVLVQIVNFLILLFVLNKILYKPLNKMMDSRRDLMSSLQCSADVSKEQLAEASAQQERLRVEVLQEGVGVHRTLKEEGQAKELEILAKAQQESAGKLEEARQAIAKDLAAAREQLKLEAEVLADELVDKLLGRDKEQHQA